MNAAGCSIGRQDLLLRIESGNGDVNAMLQPLKSRRPHLLIERDDLAVEDDRRLDLLQPRADRVDDVGKLRGLLVAVARPEAHGRRLGRAPGQDFDDGADAVDLRLVDVGRRR